MFPFSTARQEKQTHERCPEGMAIVMPVADPAQPQNLAPNMALVARRQDSHTEAPEIPVADVMGLPARFEGVDAMLCETPCRYELFSLSCCAADTESS